MNLVESISKQISKPQGVAVVSEPTNFLPKLDDFSSKTVSGNLDFLQSNSIIAKIVFIILVLIAFIVLFKIGIAFISWLLTPTRNPYLVKGLITGATAIKIPSNQSTQNAIPILRSNNENKGIEFTWSVWLFFNSAPINDSYSHIFNKGDIDISNNPMTNYNNSPGLYVYRKNTSNVNSVSPDNLNLVVLMSSFDYDTDNRLYNIVIDNIPLKKWINVVIRMQNNILDVYINGTISQRAVFQNTVPRQNYGSVNVCQSMGTNNSTGFNGYLSNLRYYDHALNAFSISNIVSSGPNLTPNTTFSANLTNTSNSNFFDSKWFTTRF